ncbi:MAG: hypothetical protein NC489_38695, partial [Ruminococcus flavefaciens]|nr:hypothetical protein [Ruminococcus flavefaciens]
MKSLKNLSKRALALVLSLVLCVSLLPGTAFAAGNTITCGKSDCNRTATYVPQVDPTCQKEGVVAHYECSAGHNTSLDGKWFSGKVTRIPTVDHNYTEYVSTTATCTEGGKETYKCEWCSKTTTKSVGATGHQNTEKVNEKAATCTEAGYTGDTYCNDCEQTIEWGEAIPATGHQNTETRNAE